jgi:hypothetical protein
MINDNTIVKVKVPRHLYEAIQKKLALKEAYEKEMKEADKKEDDEKPKYAGTKMSKGDVLSKVGKGKQSRKVQGDKAKAYQPVHSRVYKEGEDGQLNESVLLAGLATLLGVGGSIIAALVSDLRKAKTKEEKADVLRGIANTIAGSKGISDRF